MFVKERDTDRSKVVYFLAIGHSIGKVASILMIEEEILRAYKRVYEKGGIPI